MPEFGEIRKAREIGKKGSNKYIWTACIDCGTGRWALLSKGKPAWLRCQSCGGKLHPESVRRGPDSPNWKEGSKYHGKKYLTVRIRRDDFFYPMAEKDGAVMLHRLLMAKYLKRCLLP